MKDEFAVRITNGTFAWGKESNKEIRKQEKYKAKM